MPKRNDKKPNKLKDKGEKKGKKGSGRKKPGEFELYAMFLALPWEERKEIFNCQTDQDFSKKYKVAAQTLSEWKLIPKLWERRDTHLIVFKKHTAEIMGALAKRAKKGYGFEFQQWMKYVEGVEDPSAAGGGNVEGFNITIVTTKHNAAGSKGDNSIAKKS